MKFFIAHAHLHAHRSVRIRGERLNRAIDAIRHIGHQPTRELPPRLLHIQTRRRIFHAPLPEITDHQRRGAATAKTLHSQCGQFLAFLVAHARDHTRAGLERTHAIDHVKRRHRVDPRPLVAFVVTQPRPRLQPAFTRELQMHRAERRGRLRLAVEVNREHITDRRAHVFTFLETLHAAEHQKTAAPLGHKSLQQHGLFRRKKFRLQVIQNHRVIPEQILRRARKSRAQFDLVARIEPHEHRLIVTLHFLGRLIAEAPEERIARLARTPTEIEFRLAFRDSDQPHELNLFVAHQSTVEKLKLPIRPA